MNFPQLKENVLGWAKDKGILNKSSLLSQIGKTQEELTETRDAIIRLDELRKHEFGYGYDPLDRIDDLKKEIKDGIGDQIVTLIIECRLADLEIEDCLEHAWNEIKDRTGHMEGGIFVKDV